MFDTQVLDLEISERIVAIICIVAPILFLAFFDFKKCRKCGSRLADRITRIETIQTKNKIIIATLRYRICYRCGDKMLLRKKTRSEKTEPNKKVEIRLWP